MKHHHSVDPTITSTPLTLEGCHDPGCFSDNITYDATLEQIEAIIFLSKDCRQEITHKCSVNRITGYSWWVGRDGSENSYWHGNSDNDEGCACFSDSSCGRFDIK